MQYTTTASRWGAYVGAIPHWLYFTPLRKHGPQWSRVVIWSSGIGTVAAHPRRRHRRLDVFAVEEVSQRRRADEHSVSRPEALAHDLRSGLRPRRGDVGVQRHAVDGSVSAADEPARRAAAADRARSHRRSATAFSAALRGRTGARRIRRAKHPQEALAQLAGLQVKELELTSFMGEPVYLATLADGDTRIVPVDGEPIAGFTPERITEVVTKAAGRTALAEITHDRSVRHVLPRSPSRAAAAGDARAAERRRARRATTSIRRRRASSAATARATG